MTSYRLNAATYEATKQKLGRQLTITSVIVSSVVTAVFGLLQLTQPPADHWPYLLFLIFGVSLIGTLSGRARAFKRLKTLYDTYELTMDGYSIGVQSLEISTVVPKHEIKGLLITQTGDMQLQIANQAIMVGIPAHLEHFDEVKASLLEFIPAETVKKTTVINPLVGALFVAIPLGITQVSQDLIIVALAAVACTAASGFIFWRIVSARDVKPGTKATGLLMLLPIGSSLLRVVALLIPILNQNVGQ